MYMNLEEALKSSYQGNFVRSEHFGTDESLHYYKGQLYYEDGAIVKEIFLREVSLFYASKWYIAINAVMIDREALEKMHEESYGLTLCNNSYMDCIKQ